MEPQEMAENTEKAKEAGQGGIGLTMAIFAVLLSIATMVSHRAHTEEVLLETQATDQWNYFQAKNIRSHVYDADAELAGLFGDRGAAQVTKFHSQSAQQKKDSEEIQKEAEKLGAEVRVVGHKARFYDAGELFLELGIVLCSISLLSGRLVYWHSSFLFSAIAIGSVLWGMVVVH